MNSTDSFSPLFFANSGFVQAAEREVGLADGLRRRDAALSSQEARRARLITRARRALLERLLFAGVATADDVREALGDLPSGIGPQCLGAVPRALVRAGIIEAAGFAPTTRPTAHARPVVVWRLCDPDAARKWLDDHPEPMDDRDDLPLWQIAQQKRPAVAPAERLNQFPSTTKGINHGSTN